MQVDPISIVQHSNQQSVTESLLAVTQKFKSKSTAINICPLENSYQGILWHMSHVCGLGHYIMKDSGSHTKMFKIIVRRVGFPLFWN